MVWKIATLHVNWITLNLYLSNKNRLTILKFDWSALYKFLDRYGKAEGRRVRCAGMKHSWSHMFSDDGKIRCRHKFSIKVKSSSFFHLRRDLGVPSPFVSNRHNIFLEKWNSFHGENTERVELRTQWDWGDWKKNLKHFPDLNIVAVRIIVYC